MARKIAVTVKPGSKSPGVMPLSDKEFRLAVRQPAHDGEANRAVIELLARYFGVSKSQIKILRGRSSRKKIIEIDSPQ